MNKTLRFAHVDCVEIKGRRGKDGRYGFYAKYAGKCAVCMAQFPAGARITAANKTDPLPEAKEEVKDMAQVEINPPAETNKKDMANKPSEILANQPIGDVLYAALSARLEQRLATFEAKSAITQTIVLHAETERKVDVGITHESFERVLRWVRRGQHCWLAGPTGSGKTTLAEQVAKALEQPFFYSGALWDSVGLSGYKDVNGNYVRTLFREAYENGGLFLLDEVDACEPSVLLWLNGALANGVCAFPDGMIKRHPKFVCLCAANTYGHGATHEYVGRMKQDNAFLNRFRKIAVDYDAKLERALASNDAWYKRVCEIRKRIAEKGLRVVISPRNTIAGALALADGQDWASVEQECLADEMTAEQWASVCR